MSQITGFSIKGLHGSIDVDVPISDGKVILVGVNGLGKTTIVSMLYFVLTRQWQKLLEYEFNIIYLTLDSDQIEINQSVLAYPDISWQTSIFESLPIANVERIRTSKEFRNLVFNAGAGFSNLTKDDVVRVARRIEVPVSHVERILFDSIRANSKRQRKTSKALLDIEARLEKFTSQVLYLPTYRRIEQDLKSLFPEFEGDFRKAVRQRVVRDGRSGYVELVEFGMEDVESRVTAKVAALKEGSRVELNNLAGSYLRDVIRGEAKEWSGEKINQLPDHEIRLILARVEEKQLDERDKGKVFEVINRIRDRQALDSDQDLLAHFFSKLVAIHEIQQKAEVPLRQFMEVCNKYLQAKRFEFDDVGYRLTLELDRGGTIEMRGLSSGEKQIVSLFAQIYLGDAESYSLIIDEPELSLSVEWQKTLLPDIVSSGRCCFLAAVTHSPFIYDNELFDCARDLAELQRAG
ncbi:MAG: ATP-binding protein [Rhodanobacteraceae bacterium]|jgi:energy-coupling factor transporter ATP-binding protein EcfA2|nr:ATP-binding protein [Rhodanobacteraceae bacterium]